VTRPGNPDVTPVGFAATEGPNAVVGRHRSPVWLAFCLVFAVAGLAGIGVAIAGFTGAVDVDRDAVAVGRIAALDGPPTPGEQLRAPEEQVYTLWLSTSGVVNSLHRERIVAATNCTAQFADGGSVSFRGAIQGSSVVLGDRATVGTFTAPAGEMRVACHQESFGPLRGRNVLRSERDFYVVPGTPPGGWQEWVFLFAGITLLMLAPLAGGRWWQGSLRGRGATVWGLGVLRN